MHDMLSYVFYIKPEARRHNNQMKTLTNFVAYSSSSDPYLMAPSDNFNAPYCVYPPSFPSPTSTTFPTPTFPFLQPPPSPESEQEPPPGPPEYERSPPEFIPGTPAFLPPIVYPPPSVPPPPYRGPTQALWCVAKPTVPDPIILEAMNYACGSGADCDAIQPNGACFQPDTLISHASFAFNSYWQRTKLVGGTCDFGDVAMLITRNPSNNQYFCIFFTAVLF